MADIEENPPTTPELPTDPEPPTTPEPVVTSEAEDAPHAKEEGETAWYKVHHGMHGFLWVFMLNI